MATFPSDSVRTKNWGTEILTDADLEGQLDVIHDYIKAALNSATGHSHDGTSNQSAKLTSGAIGSTFVSGLTTVTGASSDYLMIADASDSNAPKKALASDFTYTPSASNALTGSTVQVVNTQTGAVATGTTTIPFDDTIPQNTEGDEYMTRSITPNSATNKLKITVVMNWGASAGTRGTMALFQDSTANALASVTNVNASASFPMQFKLVHYMTSGTTSATTFKVRAGVDGGATFTFNGVGGGRIDGGVQASSITIEEVKV